MRRFAFGLAAVAAFVLATDTPAQQPPPGLPSPRINTVFPAGAKIGTTIEVTVSGFDLDEPTGLLFSHPGIKGEPVDEKAPPPDPKKKGAAKNKKRNPGDPHPFQITVAANVPAGVYDLRVVGKWGVSNARAFAVGELPELNEKEPNNDVPEAQKVEIGTTINGVISAPTDVDYTTFAAKKGQRVIISCLASSIDSRAKPQIEVYDISGRKLAQNHGYRSNDAVTDLIVPADGDYLIRLSQFTYQTGGADHVYRLTIATTPWIDAVYPSAIEPGKPAQVTLYGRNLPGGAPSGFVIDGRIVEKAVVTVTPPSDPLAAQRLTVRDLVEPATSLQDGFEYRLKGPAGLSNPVPIYFTREKMVLKKNAGGTKAETAEPLTTPCEVVGMLHKRNDRDWYSFEAKKGDVLMIEVTAERNGSSADFYFNVYNPGDPKGDGKLRDISGEIDDDTTPDASLHPSEFYSRSGDPPAYRFTAPADGKFLIAVSCRESTYLYGPQTIYRLRAAPPRPDFRAVVKPYSKSYQTGSAGLQGNTEVYEVFVQRIDGFNGPVTLTAEGLPPGVTAKPTIVGPAAKWGMLVLHIAPTAAAYTGPIAVKATAPGPDGKPLIREVRPITVVWGNPQANQNTPVLSRRGDSLLLAVRPEKGFFTVTAEPAKATIKPANAKEKETKANGPLVVKPGDKVAVPVKIAWTGAAEKPNVTLASDPVMPGQQNALIAVTFAPPQSTKDKPESVANLDVKANAPPGTYSLPIRGDAQVAFVRDKAAKGGKGANVPASAFADSIEVTVLPTTLAKITPGTLPNNAVKVGMTAELVVKIDRQHGYTGEYKVRYELPKGVAGVTVADVTVPADKNEARLVVKAAPDAKPGAVNGGTITVTAQYDGKYPVATEAEVNFTITK